MKIAGKMRCLLLWMAVCLCMAKATKAQQRTKNVILISMDGYRWKELFNGADSVLLAQRKYNSQDSAYRYGKYWAATPEARREKLMPFVWGTLASKGQLYGNRQLGNKVDFRNYYWFSYPGRSEVLTGYFDTAVNSNGYPDNPNENILEFVNKQKGYAGKVVTFASWDVVARIVNRKRNGMLVNIDGEDVQGPHLTDLQKAANQMQHLIPGMFGRGERMDGNTFLLAKSYLVANKPRMMYIDLADTDVFGHEGKYDFYLDAAHYADAMLADLWAYLQQDPFYKGQTTILVYPDHGRGEDKQWVSHGRGVQHAGEGYLMAIGPDTAPTGEQKAAGQLYLDQCAQTVARLLGFTFTANHPVGALIPAVIK